MLGDSVSVYLNGGPAGTGYPTKVRQSGSTIVDATGLLQPGGRLTIVRSGVIADEAIWKVLGETA
jgi:tRNA A37 threonylcarbamoyladenosine synthetase subunit TsaC/SUA5/YrdC